MKTNVLATMLWAILIILIAQVAASAQNKTYTISKNVMSAQVKINLSVAFGKGHENPQDKPYSVWIAFDGGQIIAGDTVIMAPANMDQEWEYVYPPGETLNLNEKVLDFWLDYQGLKTFADNGLEYVRINGQFYLFDKKQIEASKRLARKALLKVDDMGL